MASFSSFSELANEFYIGDGPDDVTTQCSEFKGIEDLALASSLCSSLILTGCIAMRITFEGHGDDEDMEVELTDIPSCLCNLALAVHHNEETDAANLRMILIEVQDNPDDTTYLSDAIFQGLNIHYNLENRKRLGGWLSQDQTILSTLWDDLGRDLYSSDSD